MTFSCCVDTLLYPKLSYKVVGICFEAHNELGRFAREKQYGNYIEDRLKSEEIKYKRELSISDSGNKVDFLIAERVVLELKVKDLITKNDYFQVQRYLQSSGIKLGIIVNFRNKNLRPKRILKTNKSGYELVFIRGIGMICIFESISSIGIIRIYSQHSRNSVE